jgi:hypothetical protein
MGWVINATAPAALPREKDPGSQCTGGWVGHKCRCGRVRKISHPPGFDPRTVLPVASLYTDYAIPVQGVGVLNYLYDR